MEVQQLTALFADLFKTVEEGQAPDTDSVRRSVELLRQAEFAPTALRDDVLLTYRGRPFDRRPPARSTTSTPSATTRSLSP